MSDKNPPPPTPPKRNFIFDYVTHWEDRVLPSQPILSMHYRHPADEYHARLMALISRVSTPPDPEARFALETPEDITFTQFGSSMFVLKHLEMLIKIGKYRRILEIGSFVGVSAMCFADAAGPDGHVVTVEKYPNFAAIAQRNIQRNGFADRITLLQGDALEMLDTIGEMDKFDMIFLDGDKENYDTYYMKFKDLLKDDGLFVIDDIFFHADTLNDVPATSKGAGVAALLDRLSQDAGCDKVVSLAVNGALLVRRCAASGPA